MIKCDQAPAHDGGKLGILSCGRINLGAPDTTLDAPAGRFRRRSGGKEELVHRSMDRQLVVLRVRAGQNNSVGFEFLQDSIPVNELSVERFA